MRNYLAQRAGVNPAREFFLLWALGQDLAGAITVAPADGEALPPMPLDWAKRAAFHSLVAKLR